VAPPSAAVTIWIVCIQYIVGAARVCNGLPPSVQSAPSLSVFCRTSKYYYYYVEFNMPYVGNK